MLLSCNIKPIDFNRPKNLRLRGPVCWFWEGVWLNCSHCFNQLTSLNLSGSALSFQPGTSFEHCSRTSAGTKIGSLPRQLWPNWNNTNKITQAKYLLIKEKRLKNFFGVRRRILVWVILHQKLLSCLREGERRGSVCLCSWHVHWACTNDHVGLRLILKPPMKLHDSKHATCARAQEVAAITTSSTN